ncbi:MAG: SusC/RagA family TonB-linked outer membrane protein [Mangrovibacterium sp.]
MKRIALILAIFVIGLQSAMAQNKTITGTVTSADDGTPVPGVTVVVKGTTIGTLTDIDGKYAIEAPANATTLTYSFVGMETHEEKINGAIVNTQMKSDAVAVDEVVVTALGIKREAKALGYATQKMDNEELNKAGNSDLAKSLQGKLAGVEVKMSSGMPGASSQIVIRGARSFTGDNTPLYVVDGMPISSTAPFSTGNSVTGADISNRALDINPNDIESINVLKGQAAAALYGLRASNGVVIITTKSGKGAKKGKPQVSLSQVTSFETPSRYPNYQTKYAQGYNGEYDPMSSMAWGPLISELPNDPTYGYGGKYSGGKEGQYYVPQRASAGLDPWAYPQSYDNYGDYFETGVTSTTNINLSQATDKGNFAIGLGRTGQVGIAPNTGMERWNAIAAADTKLNDNFKAGFSANFSMNNIDKLSSGNDASLAGVYAAPSSYDLKGTPSHALGDPYEQVYYRGGSFDNPYWIEDNNTFNEKTNRFFGNGYVDYNAKLAEGMTLDVKYQLGVDTYTTHYQNIFGYGSKNESIENAGVTNLTYNSLLTANYDWVINDDWHFSALLGNELNDASTKNYEQYGQSFNFGGWNHIDNAQTVTATEKQYKQRTVGFFTNLALSWRDMLFLNVTGRNDITSTMPRNNRSFFYPSVSLGWVATELAPLKDLSWLSFLKLRGSYAEVGQAGTYYDNYYSTPNYGGGMWANVPIQYPTDGVNAYTPNTIMYDPNLRPQNTKSYELGIESKFFHNRLGFDYTYSRQNVTDQIFQVPLAASTGMESMVMNGGKLHTISHELVVYATPIQTKDFSWDIQLNFSKMVNMVDELAEGVNSIMLGGFVTPQIRVSKGYNYPTVYGGQFKKDDEGHVLVDEDPNSSTYGMPMAGEPGELGSVMPDFQLGGTMGFTYKNISLSATLDWKSGGVMYSGSNGLIDLYGVSGNTADRTSTFVYDGYKADGSKNDIVRGGSGDEGAYQTLYSDVLGNIDEYYVRPSDYLKLRDVTLKYQFPKTWVPKVDIAVSVFARNILLWSALDNFDPESSQGNTNMAGGFERFSMPQASSYGFGVDVTF